MNAIDDDSYVLIKIMENAKEMTRHVLVDVMGQRTSKKKIFAVALEVAKPIMAIRRAQMNARTRQNRRDRRKAKQSRWRRPGKTNPRKVGHGGSGQR